MRKSPLLGSGIAPRLDEPYLTFMSSPDRTRHQNRLIHETSPYLLQHAHNPVDWYPWGPDALVRSKREDKPLLLSIGYAACHWCHVMERESFENEAIAALMNEHFVCVKIDREERPDLDDIYMAATVAMSGSGGWPMTVFLTPDQEPFFAGTYFPPVDKYGRPGFATLLARIAELWKTDRAALQSQAEELTQHVRAQAEAARPLSIGEDAIAKAQAQLSSSYDERWGGFGSAPKFPPPAALSLLLRHHARTGDERSLQMVCGTLNGMKNGGMYDHVAGGFARYSTDDRWLVPHFEKMLYDNAQLARVYLEAYQVTGDAEYRRVVNETLDYVMREMQSPEGGYYSATDADSEGEEGKFFVFTPDEVREILDPDAAEQFCRYYDITPEGNWEGQSILNTPRSKEAVAKELGVGVASFEQKLAESRALVYQARAERVPPLLDDKILTAWNALMIAAMAEGARVLGETRYLDSATRAANHAWQAMRRPDGGLYRTARKGKAHLDAYLEDYAYLTDALIDLYEAGAETAFIHRANELAERMILDFSDDAGGAFFHTAHAHERLLVRSREGHDGAVPNPNAVAARALARLSYHFDRERYRELSLQAIRAYGSLIQRSPRAFATALCVADFLLEPPAELVFIGSARDPAYRALVAAASVRYLPNRVIAHAEPDDRAAQELPMIAGKALVEGQAALYICENFACQAPITSAAAVAPALEQRSSRDRSATRLGAKPRAGRATATATRTFAARFPALVRGYGALGNTDLVASRVGFGGYRINDVDPEHRAALEHALESGVNLVDTSTNYTHGRSETLIGQVISDAVRRRVLTREQVIVVSKIGYVQGPNLEIAKARESSGRPFPEMVKYGSDLWHCIHPEWLEHQLTLSLDRLELETLDVCLLHNPEYYFNDAVKRGQGPLPALRDTFYSRIQAAFEHFEKEIARGRLGFYGVSSNEAGAPATERDAVELSRLVAAAERAGGAKHHFRVLQLPLNLFEAAPVFEKNNSDGTQTVLELAERTGIAVLVNRPLNAISNEHIVRLADPPNIESAPAFDAQLERVAALEAEFRKSLAPALRTASDSVKPEQFFAWAEQLREMPARLDSYEQWHEIETFSIAPQVAQICRALDDAFSGAAPATWRDWRGRYVTELERLFASLRKRAADRSRARTLRLQHALGAAAPDMPQSPLSQRALNVLLSTPGVSTVLVGMRRSNYVDDALAALTLPPIRDPRTAYRAVTEA